MNIYNAMNTAKWALLTQQSAIEVTGQNIANVNNTDYNRQTVNLTSQAPVNVGNVNIGTGVRLKSVTRQFDQYAFDQTVKASSNQSNWTAREATLNRLDILMNEAGTGGLGQVMSNMFQSYYALSQNPTGGAERADTINKGVSVATKFKSIATDLKQVRVSMNSKISSVMTEVNRISSEIANLNKRVHETEIGDSKANDYRDQRDGLVKDLSQYMDISTIEQSNNEVVVMLNDGRPLVVGQSNFALQATTNPSDPEVSQIQWTDGSGNLTNITSEFNSGEIGAWIDLRDNTIPGYLDRLDSLAAGVIRDINRLHVSGYGIDGSTGNNFFNNLTPGGRAASTNTGTGTVGVGTLTNPEIVSTDSYQVTFDGAGNYSVYNNSTGAASGSFTYTAASPLTFFQNRGFNIAIAGAPVAGDNFMISGAYNAAFNMGMDRNITSSPNKLAAGASLNPGDGTQATRIANLQYQRTMNGEFSSLGAASSGVYAETGVETFDDYLSTIIGDIGSATAIARDTRAMSDSVSKQVNALREQISGVNIDEEMVNLIKYQHAYGAAARMITTVDEMLQTLLNIV